MTGCAQGTAPAVTSSSSLMTMMATSHQVSTTSSIPSWFKQRTRALGGGLEEKKVEGRRRDEKDGSIVLRSFQERDETQVNPEHEL
ncbi:hypothetical protein KOW79_019844 [Hemibagrus wyckioides]|uniref:Uncharacterized protein n=1 Tax=Hemibagrus wyckioides TaxID=337641 RepID=A0A9D3N7M6_9TELE|nr:hypothetical protein KOW79_019844 [Hemibagrus wyckioides]